MGGTETEVHFSWFLNGRRVKLVMNREKQVGYICIMLDSKMFNRNVTMLDLDVQDKNMSVEEKDSVRLRWVHLLSENRNSYTSIFVYETDNGLHALHYGGEVRYTCKELTQVIDTNYLLKQVEVDDGLVSFRVTPKYLNGGTFEPRISKHILRSDVWSHENMRFTAYMDRVHEVSRVLTFIMYFIGRIVPGFTLRLSSFVVWCYGL